jgi:hypothetical protein
MAYYVILLTIFAALPLMFFTADIRSEKKRVQ